MKLRKVRMNEVEVLLTCLPEGEAVPGSVMASGDENFNKACEDNILTQFEAGNVWAWCIACVTVKWNGYKVTDTLGCCSYKSREDFEQGEYFEEMKSEALEQLNQQLESIFETLKPLLE